MVLGFLLILHPSESGTLGCQGRYSIGATTGLPTLVVASTIFYHWEALSGRFRLGSLPPNRPIPNLKNLCLSLVTWLPKLVTPNVGYPDSDFNRKSLSQVSVLVLAS